MATAPMPALGPNLSAQQKFILESFNSETYVNNRMDIQDTPLYDTVILTNSGATSVVSVLSTAYFTNVGPQSGKTYGLTNMSQPQKLNAPEAFSIFGFRYRYSENIALTDLYNILNTQVIEFWMGNKPYHRAPIWCCDAGGGIYGTQTLTGTSILNNGMPGRSDMHRLGINVVIENQMSFYGQLNGAQQTLSSGGTGFTSQFVLAGLYARGVQ